MLLASTLENNFVPVFKRLTIFPPFFVCVGLTLQVNAEIAISENNTDNDPTIQQTEKTIPENNQSLDELNDTETQLSTATPQPPLIDAQPAPKYGPGNVEPYNTEPTNISTAETDNPVISNAGSENDAPSDESSIESPANTVTDTPVILTPQPPLIDAQPKPSYEPEITLPIAEPYNKPASTSSPPETASSEVTEPDKANVATQSATKSDKEEQSNWTDTRPQRVSADWLQLTSGEWLRGRIIIMQKEMLEFDSDELDNLEIEWDKVKYIKSSDPYRLRFDGRVSADGAIEITQDEIYVTTDYDDQTFKRSELQNIASGKETEISKWTNKITFSINVRRGNTDQTDFTSMISAKRRTILSRLLLDYLGNFTEVQDTETINNHRLSATFDIFITRDLFLTPITAEYFRDPFLNIDQRVNVGIAVGYTLINNNETEWDISGGPAYQETNFVSVQIGEPDTDSTATLILGTSFDTELNSKVDLQGTYSVTLGDEKTGGYTHHSIITIETELTDKLDFDVSAVWDKVKSPVQAEDGTFPEPDDFRILIGLGYDL